MMILMDGGNLSSRCLFSKDVIDTQGNVDYHTWKYVVFNSILSTIIKFKDATELVIAIDSPNTWRKMIYPLYKGNRKKDDKIDWKEFYKVQQEFFHECAENLPFKMIKVDATEADDIIGVLSNKNKAIDRETIIVSNDSDFLQLCDNTIKIWNPLKKEFTESVDIENFLIEASLTGQQQKDNVYNVITPLDWDNSKRKPGLGKKKAQKIIEYGLEKWLEENNAEKAYKRNRILIDLNNIPPILKVRIEEAYKNYILPDIDKLDNWLLNCGWRAVVDNQLNIEKRILPLYGIGD